MKKVLLSLMCLWVSIGTFAQFSGSGSGTKDDPYLIFNPIQLNQVRGFLNQTGVYFKMMSDVDLTEWIADENPTQGWQPIGTSDSPFMGVFDGNGHTISGFIINRSSTDYVGFFAKISQATIQNVTINGPVTGKDNTGGVAGYVDKSTLSNIVFNGDVSGQNNVGGISGQDETGDNYKNTTFETCKYSGNIKGTNYIGGINGYCRNTTNFTNCEVHANITGNENVGGIGGYGEKFSIINITSCFAYGSISGSKYVGGLVGLLNQHTITGSGAIMDITSTNGYTGGIVGSGQMEVGIKDMPRRISNTFAIGDIITKGEHIGGIVGDDWAHYSNYYYSNLNIVNCYYSGNVQGTNDVGGIVGKGHRSQINKCYSTGTVTGNENVGGIVGRLSSETSCENTVKSCVSIHSKINALTSGVGRIVGTKASGTIGTTGSQEGNLGFTSCRVMLNGVLQTIEDGEQNGSSAGSSTLKTRGTYQAIGWNFNNDWDNIDTECYPYMKGQMAPPIIESGCYSGSTEVKGKSTNGGTVYLNTNGKNYSAKVISNQWSITTEPLQGGLQVEVYADAADMIQSYKVAQDITYKGKGTEAEPYQICTAADLANANGNYYYKLMNNIDLTDYISTHCSAEGWRPIGKGSSAMANFDGDGHTVSGLWINTTDDYVGLFSNASGAHIKNLKVVVASGKKVKGGNYTGGIIGRNYNGCLENCSFSGDVEGGNYTGGVIGYDENSQTTKISGKGNVTGGQYVGGIIGYTTGGTLQKAVFEGNVTSSTASAYIGGVAGGNNSALSLCTSKGTVVATGTGSVAGGVVGKIDAEGSLTNAYSTAEATSVSYVGGVVGYNYGSIKNCYSSANLKSDKDYGGGVVGYNDGASATTSKCVAINTKIEIADENGWASRVIGGIKNGAPVPDMDNFANKDMTISINGQPMKIYDDNLNGASKTLDVLKAQSTYEGMGWDFNMVWAMNEATGFPYLLSEIADPVYVKSISLDPQSATIEIGKSIDLVATVLPEDATKKGISWSSSNPSVATVTDGKVSAVGLGTTTITASTTDGTALSATCKVTVTAEIIPVSSVSLSKSSATVEAGKSLVLTATIEPDNATAKSLTWTSSNNDIATVDNGTVTGVTPGTVTITAETTDGTKLSASCKVTVTEQSIVYPSTDVSGFENVLYINDVEASQGAALSLPLNMKNAEENITAFECKVYLPAGVEWAYTIDKRGNKIFVQPTFNEERTDANYHTINSIKQMEDGSYYVIVYSDKKEIILDKDGAILYMPLTVSEEIEPGDYNIFVKDIVMVNENTEQVLISKTISKLTIPAYTLGDANDDGMINITDVVAVISYMLKESPNPFIFKAADVNCDEMINVTDVVGIIDIMTSGASSAKPEMAMAKKAVKKSAKTGNSLEIVPFTVAAGTTSMNVALELNNPGDEFTALECKVFLPEGVDWDYTIDRRGNKIYKQPTFNEDRTDANYHTINSISKVDGGYYVIVYSDKKEIFLDEDGALLYLPLVFDENINPGVYDIRVGDIVLARPDVTQELLDDYTASVLVGSPEIASLSLNGDFTADAIAEYNTALASNTKVAAMDFCNATDVDATTAIATGNRNLLVYVAEGKSVKNENNAVIGDACANLVITDGYSFCAPKAFTAAKASYTRTATNTLGTLCLPFAPTSVAGDLYELTSSTETSLTFSPVTTPKAGVPYLYYCENDKVEASNVAVGTESAGSVTSGDWTMTGTYEPQVFSASDNAFAMFEGKLYKNTGTLTMNPFRAYFTTTGSAAKADIFVETPTGIENISAGSTENNGRMYNLQGIMVNKNYQGMKIVNGKKYIK